MSMEVSGGVELREDIARMADLLRTSGENGSRACNWILQNAAQPVLEQMLHKDNILCQLIGDARSKLANRHC